MNEATNQILAELAQSMGVAVEVLWAALIRQAPIDFFASSIQYALIVAGAVWWAKRFLRLQAKYEDKYDWDGSDIAITVVSGVLLAIGASAAFFYLPTFVASFANPEYWALQKVLTLIGGQS